MSVLPAYAGMIRHRLPVQGIRLSAPRVCGDDPFVFATWLAKTAVLPAYAGMILPTMKIYENGPCAPRVCGDDPPQTRNCFIQTLCSPRMRG